MNENFGILPDKKVNIVIVDKNAPKEFFNYLTDNNISYIKSTTVDNVLDEVSTHPDMQICYVGKNTYVCEPTTYEYYKNALKLYGVNVTKGTVEVMSNYPYDIAYNVVITEKFMMHKITCTDKAIMDNLNNQCICDTKQGYTKCATCIIDDNAVITSDKGIYKTCLENNIDCLVVCEDEICLGRRKDGFLGGCCGLIDDKTLLFCGDITKHKNYLEIKEFGNKYGVKLIASHNGQLTDIGSIIPVIQE